MKVQLINKMCVINCHFIFKYIKLWHVDAKQKVNYPIVNFLLFFLEGFHNAVVFSKFMRLVYLL